MPSANSNMAAKTSTESSQLTLLLFSCKIQMLKKFPDYYTDNQITYV